MGTFLSELIVDVLRQAVPIIGATIGAQYGAQKTSGTGAKRVAKVAGYAGAGWLTGYAVKSFALMALGRSRRLPTETMQKIPQGDYIAPQAPMVNPHLVPGGPTAGLDVVIDPYAPSSSQVDLPNRPSGEGREPKVPNQDGVSFGTPPGSSVKRVKVNLDSYGGMGN